MVRILKVTALAGRKQRLRERSELYRQTMGVELANIKYSAARLHRKVRMAKSGLWLAAAVAGFFLVRRRDHDQPQPVEGLLARIRSGVKYFGMAWPLLKNFFGRTPAGGQNGEAEDAADAF